MNFFWPQNEPYEPDSLHCVQHDGRSFVIVTHGKHSRWLGGIHSYDAQTKDLIWKSRGKLPQMQSPLDATGITSDRRGHLYVCDYTNQRIHMFSVVNGRYMGVLGQGKLKGAPWKIQWWEETSSLVIIHYSQGKWHISVWRVEVDSTMTTTSLSIGRPHCW